MPSGDQGFKAREIPIGSGGIGVGGRLGRLVGGHGRGLAPAALSDGGAELFGADGPLQCRGKDRLGLRCVRGESGEHPARGIDAAEQPQLRGGFERRGGEERHFGS